MRESDIEDYLLKCVKEAGGQTRKVAWIGRKDAPDRLVMLNKFACFVELKAPREKPRASQMKEHAVLRWANIPVVVIDSFAGVERLIFERKFF